MNPMKIEPNGEHVCATHASKAARTMTMNEVVDYLAECGCKPRCVRCLHLSGRGEIACGEHSPGHGSDSWVLENWAAITPEEADEFERDLGRGPACETCNAMARRAG